MKRYNNFTTSYGLIVKTYNNRVMLIKRKVPYCVQNFYIFLHKNNFKYEGTTHDPFYQVKETFEKTWLPKLSESDRLDYMRFIKGEMFEDLYDFPHGQVCHKYPQTLHQYFMTAYREFREETGYRFFFTKEDVKNYPIVKVEFTGCDKINYKQFYFVVENVKELRRNRYFDSFEIPLLSTVKIKNWNDDRLVFKSKLLSMSEAYIILKKQQEIKTDFKHLLLENSLPKYYIICRCKDGKDDENELTKRLFS